MLICRAKALPYIKLFIAFSIVKLKRKVEKENTTIADIVRNAVSEVIVKEKSKNWIKDSLWDMVGSSSSKDRDLSINHDKYLYGKNR